MEQCAFLIIGRLFLWAGRAVCMKDQQCTKVYRHWSQCTRTCGGGIRLRTGRCCGNNCGRDINQTESCNTQPCEVTTPPPLSPTATPNDAVDGNWSPWSTWVTSSCSKSCCGGIQSRTRQRSCTNPPPSGEGMPCTGFASETEDNITCNPQDCPLSCENKPTGTIFPTPCVACSNIFWGCEGPSEPVPFTCPLGNVWSPSKFQCSPTCDP